MDQNKIWDSFGIKTDKQNPRALTVNTVLAGKYLVGPVLGEGGFGITYAGYDLNMETRIAIKEYFPVELVTRDTTLRNTGGGGAASGSSDSDGGEPSAGSISASGGGSDRVISLSGEKSKTYQQGLKKYVDEARNVSQFSGVPGIVSVKDFFYENNTAYIVMEYIEGVSLREYLKQKGGKVSEKEALAILRPVLEALEKVHAAGIVHRDISPDNIMLTFAEQGDVEKGKAERSALSHKLPDSASISTSAVYGNISAVKLIDFGAARMTSQNDQKSLTIILKHGYAPEEQYRSHGEQGPWTDVYALCAVLYRMLTGKVPEPAMDRLFSDGLKRPEELGVKITPAVSEAIMRGLAVKKEDRIQSVRELMDTLYAGKKLKKKGTALQFGKFSVSARAAVLAVGCVLVLAAGIAVVGIGLPGWNTPSAAVVDGLEAAVTDGAGAPESGQTGENDTDGTVLPETADETSADETVPASGSGQAPEGAETLMLEEKAYEPGEQIVWPKAETMIAGGYKHLVSLRDDGTVLAAGDNSAGQCNVQDWESIAAVYAHGLITAGLRTDGTVVVAGRDALSESVSSWQGVTMLALGSNHILGLTQDGRVLSAGTNQDGCCETGSWGNIVSICARDNLSIGIREDGSVVLTGMISGIVTEEEQKTVQEEISSWTNIRQIVSYGGFLYGLKQDGTVLCAGRENESLRQQLAGWNGICSLTAGDGFVAGLREDGRVAAVQYTINDQRAEVSQWKDVVALTGTMYNLAALCRDGSILVTEPGRGGSSTTEELLALTDAVQAVWQGDILAVLCRDGTVKSAGYVEYYRDETAETGDWQEIIALSSNDDIVGGIRRDGAVIRTEFDGVSVSNELAEEFGREEAVEMAWKRKEQTPDLISGWTDVKALSMSDDHAAALLSDGTAAAAGFPEDQSSVDYRTGLTLDNSCQVDGWSDLKQVLALNGETIGLQNDGTLLTTGEMPGEWNVYTGLESIWGYQRTAAAIRSDGTVVYLYKGDDSYGQNNVSGWTDMVQLSIGENHTVGLRADGTVTAVGDNYAGQCDVEDWSGVASIAAGESGTAGITEDGRVLLAGTLPGDYFVAETWPAVTVPEG